MLLDEQRKFTEKGKKFSTEVLDALSPLIYEQYISKTPTTDILRSVVCTIWELRDPGTFKRLILKCKAKQK